MPTISVVIPTYRRPRLLEACLKSLFAGEPAAVRQVVLVVHEDDAQGLRSALRWARERPLIRVVYTAERSRSAARNAAVDVSEGDWCYFLDDDVVLLPDTIPALCEAIARFPEAAAIGGPNRMPADSALFERCVDHTLGSRLGAWRMRARYVGAEGPVWVDERSLIACNLAVRRSVLRGGNRFHEWLDYGEETLLLARLRLRGGRLLHVPRMCVVHRRRDRWRGFCSQAFRSGAGRARQSLLLPRSLSPEFLAPPALAASLAALPFARLWAAAPLALYAACCLLHGARVGWRERSLRAAGWASALVVSGHLAFGLGFWMFPLLRPWPSFGGRWLGWRKAFGAWALRAAAIPGLSFLLRGYYWAGLRAVRIWCSGAADPARELWLHRGLTHSEWRPGSSDVDLMVELPELGAEAEGRWTESWHRGYHRLRRYFPILGEVQLATRPEWRYYLAHGDIRSLDLAREARPQLAGRPLPRRLKPPPDPDACSGAKLALDAWTEQFHAYVRCARLYFDDREEPLRAAAHARNALLDVARYGGFIGRGGWRALPRAEAAAALRRVEGPLTRPLFLLERARGSEAARRAVEEAFLACVEELDASARQTLKRVPQGDPPRSLPSGDMFRVSREHEDFVGFCARLGEVMGGTLLCVVHDNVYHMLLGVRGDGLEGLDAWRALRSARRRDAALAGTFLPLPPDALRLAFWSPILEDPLRALSLAAALAGASSGTIVSGSTPWLKRHVLSAWNIPSNLVCAPPKPLARVLLRESLAHLLVNWRTFGGLERRENDYYRWTYLYSRVMSLGLYWKTGEFYPLFPLEPLARRFAQAFPGDRAWIEEHVLDAMSIGDWKGHRLFFSRRLAELVKVQAEITS